MSYIVEEEHKTKHIIPDEQEQKIKTQKARDQQQQAYQQQQSQQMAQQQVQPQVPQITRQQGVQEFGDSTIASQLADLQIRQQSAPMQDNIVPQESEPFTPEQLPTGSEVYTWDDLGGWPDEGRGMMRDQLIGIRVGNRVFYLPPEGDFTLEQKQEINALLDQGYESEFITDEPVVVPETPGQGDPADPGDGWTSQYDIGTPPEMTPGTAPTGAPSIPGLTPGQPAQPYQDANLQYRGDLEGMLANRPQYEMTEQEMLEAAMRDAGLMIDPHQHALGRSHEQMQQALDAQRAMAEASHAGYQTDIDYAMGEAQRQATESAIARGGGRAGLVDWQSAKLMAPIMGSAEAQAARHEATMNDIAAQKTMAQRHYGEHMNELEQRRGELTQQRMQQLEELQYARAVDDWDRAWRATQQLEMMDEQIRQFDNQMQLQTDKFHESQRQFDNQFALQAAGLEQQQWQFTESLSEQQRQFDNQMQQRNHEFIENLKIKNRALDLEEKKLISDLAFRDKQFEQMLQQFDLEFSLKEWMAEKSWSDLTPWEQAQLPILIAELIGRFPDVDFPDFDWPETGGGI